ncbi:zinc finger protein 773-like isoform X2 [Periophthalmus magnuspinnatus]|uniref:zinc finger protein 773-like isoform X2 n=1 Tax=Periophthalmus magnuspinnatus TaxID=409849 RepID=UPI002436AD95|nr:zinc finger protein 773-like isoform X2 [Periophthalmus magnuspinnatus]
MCEKRRRLRAQVTERLTAAADEICALFERTIAEYEEELSRSKEENQRKQRLLDSALRRLQEQGGAEENAEEEENVLRLKQENLEHRQEPEPGVHWETEPFQSFNENLDYGKTEMNFETQGYLHDKQTEQSMDSENDRGEEAPVWEPETEQFYEEKESSCVNTFQSSEGAKRTGGRTQKQCAVCEKVFGNSKDLKRHMVVHTGEKPYSCSVCGKKFTRKGSMQYHMAVHTGDRPFRCHVCSKTFSQKGNLQAHLALHSGEKPFSCSDCGARFSSQPPLIRHRKVHTGDRPFSCPFCSKGFTRNEHLQRHMQTHTSS